MENELGRGAYGHVSKMVHIPTDTMMAVKVCINMIHVSYITCSENTSHTRSGREQTVDGVQCSHEESGLPIHHHILWGII